MSNLSPKLPIFFRLLRGFDRLIFRCLRVWVFLRDEIAWLLTNHRQRAEITAAIYSEVGTFNPGGELFEGGLFGWEKDLLSLGILPTKGRILLGGAGGGREIKGLCDRGYSVVGFEPAKGLAVGAEKLVATLQNASFRTGSYEEFVSAETDLRKWIGSGPFDIVWLGYGSLSHVTDEDVRRGIFRTAKELAPRAFVVLSAFGLENPEKGILGKIRRRLGSNPGDGFYFQGGFYHQFSRDEIQELAHAFGYRVAHYASIPQGQFAAVLTPV